MLDFMLEKSKTVEKLIAENPELADYIEHLENIIKYQAEDNKKWQEVVEDRANTNKDLHAELSFYIQINPNLKKKWNNALVNKAMSEWFDKYQEEGKTLSESYKLVYYRAIAVGFINEVKHYPEGGELDHYKAIIDKVRKRLKTHRDRLKKATEDTIQRQIHTK
jgi:hypothetical protein